MSTHDPLTTNIKRNGVTLLVVLALMVMFALLVTAFMVIVSHHRRNAEIAARILIEAHAASGTLSGSIQPFSSARNDDFEEAIRLLLAGKKLDEDLPTVIAPHSILENLLGQPATGTPPTLPDPMLLFGLDETDGKPFALRPNILAPNADGTRAYWSLLESKNVQMNSDYTAPDYMTMFLAWNDFQDGTLAKIIPSFHRPQLVKYWQKIENPDSEPDKIDPAKLRKYVLRPLPTDHPLFTGSNPAADLGKVGIDGLLRFLTNGPWDVDNDGSGRANGIWLDIGLSLVQDEKTGKYYKPLVSYYVIDMDSRISVNAWSNKEVSPTNEARGMGLGAAELSSTLLTDNVLTERYGEDKKPGDYETNNALPESELLALLKDKHGINWDAYTKGGLVADWFGTLPITFDEWGNREKSSADTTEMQKMMREIPYLMNPYRRDTGDTPFNSEDLASLLHSIVETRYNSNFAPHRFRELLGEDYDPSAPTFAETNKRFNLTTRSSDIPTAAKYLPKPADADGNVTYETFEQRARDLGLWDLLPEEVRDGRKVNLNRLTLLDEWATHWKSGATPEEKNALIIAKFKFAQEMFYLMQVLFPVPESISPTERETRLERLAQWSVNLVDFIDPDDVMTPFIYSKNASEDCTTLINTLLNNPTSFNLPTGHDLIWGFEKPEVAITETFAVHNRNVQHRNAGGPNGGFYQHLRPEGSLFVELYWQRNPQRDYSASSLVAPDGSLNLGKRVGDSTQGNLIWRVAIGEASKTTTGQFKWDEGSAPEKNALQQLLTPGAGEILYPQFSQWFNDNNTPAGQYRTDLGRPERLIWFRPFNDSDFPIATSDVRRYSYANAQGMNTVLASHNPFLVIAPRTITDFNSSPVSINLPSAMIAEMVLTGSANRQVGVNVSEPLPQISGTSLQDGYTDGLNGNPVPWDTGILRQRGTIPCYKTICLQRLADPNRPHHSIGNPYITVDWSMVDLQVINSVEEANTDVRNDSDPGTAAPSNQTEAQRDADMHFASRQWKQTTSTFSNLWDRTLTSAILGADKAGLEKVPAVNGYEVNNNGLLTTQPIHTLGVSNYPDTASTPFLHFPWHDAPFMNTGELMLVPASAPGRFGVEFHDNGDESNTFYGIYDWFEQTGKKDDKPRFGYHYDDKFTFSPYPNWAGKQSDDEPSEMVNLFDFVHVPTKFAGTRDDDGNVYREPGKINLNTITEEGWNALENGRANFPSYEAFRDSRKWHDENDPNAVYPSEYKPFRSPSAVNLVPELDGNPDALVGTPTSATLLELGLIDDDADNPYMALENAMRLSDVTTVRSNVFAIWITVGYFEVDKFDKKDNNGEYDDTLNLEDLHKEYPVLRTHIDSEEMFRAVYPDRCVLGAEKGLNDGTVQRHRAFYLIDRSSPLLVEDENNPGSFKRVEFQRGAALEDVKSVIIGEPVPL